MIDAARELGTLVSEKRFALDRPTSDRLHALVAREEALEWGHFRGAGTETAYTPSVALGAFPPYVPPVTKSGGNELVDIFENGIEVINTRVANLYVRGFALFLFMALQQFYFDGNKCTARFMMNGLFLSDGFDAISIAAAQAEEFHTKMERFYRSREGGEMMDFLHSCDVTTADG